ncbi:MAG: hypothetical protein WC222_08365 [Parachlamydiales bacterium]|jgi:hypothetical protein
MTNNSTVLIENINCRYNSGDSLESLISDMFAPSLFGDELVERSSLHGRISVVLHDLFAKTPVLEKIKAKVLAAFDEFSLSATAFDAISVSLRREFVLLSQPKKNKQKFPTQDVEVHKVVQENLQKKRALLVKGTYFEEVRETALPVTQSIIEDWLYPSEKPSTDMEKFLTALFPALKNPLAAINSGLIEMKKLQEEFIQKAKESEIPEALKFCTKQFAAKLNALKPDQSLLYCGSFGRNINSIFSLLQLSQHLPEKLKEKIPPETLKILNSISSTNPQNFVKDFLHEGLGTLIKKIPALEPFLSNPAVTVFFKNTQNHLPEHIRTALPPIYANAVENLMQNGVIYSLLYFVPESSAKELIQWITQHPEELLKIENNQKFAEEFEKKIIDNLLPLLSETLQPLDNSVNSLLQTTRQLIKPEFIELLGLDEMLSGGRLWIDFKRNSNGNFDLKIYGSEQALLYHPHTDGAFGFVWPLCFQNVPAENLDKDFLFSLLGHALEPLINPQMASTPRDIYNNLFKTLEATPALPPHEINISREDFGNDWDFLLNFMFPSQRKESRNYKITREILVGYIESLKDSSGNVVPDSAQLDLLKKITVKLEKEAKAIINTLPASELDTIQKTLAWLEFERTVLDSVKIEKKQTQLLPDSLKDSLIGFLSQLGITPNSLNNSKRIILDALGDDVEPLFNLIEAELNIPSLVDDEQLPPQFQQTKGWLRDSLYKLHSTLIYNVYRLALGFSTEDRSTEYTMFKYTRLAHSVLVDVLPSPLRQWYCSAVDYITKAIKGIALNFVIWAFTSSLQSKDLEYLKDIQKSVHTKVKALVAHTNLHPKIELQINKKTPPLLKINLKTEIDENILDTYVRKTIAPGKPISTPFYPLLSFPENPQDIFIYLNSLLHEMEQLLSKSPSAISTYALLSVKQWPIPHREKETIWDHVDMPEQCIEIIWKILSQTNPPSSSCTHIDKLLINYTGLAILDKLTRRIDPNLEGLCVFAAPLYKAYRGDHPVYFIETYHRIQALKDYFLSHLKLDGNRSESAAEINKHAHNALFHSPADKSWKAEINKHAHNALFHSPADKSWKAETSQEGIYYKRLINGRSAEELFPLNSMESDPLCAEDKRLIDRRSFEELHTKERYRPSTENELIILLENESHILNEVVSPIPRSFAILKRHAIYCAMLGNLTLSFDSPLRRHIKNIHPQYGPRLSAPVRSKNEKKIRKFMSRLVPDPAVNWLFKKNRFMPAFTDNILTTSPVEIPLNAGIISQREKDKFDQHSQMDGAYKNPSRANVRHAESSITGNVKKDSFFRSLEYLELNKNDLIAFGDHYNAFSTLNSFFRPHLLNFKSYSFDSISSTIELTHKLLLLEGSYKWSFDLLRFSLLLKDLEPLFGFDRPLVFPDYRDIIYKKLYKPIVDNSSWLLIALSFPVNPSSLTLSEKKEGALALLMAQFNEIAREDEFFSERFVLWTNVILDCLKDSIFTNTFARMLLTTRSVLIHTLPDTFVLRTELSAKLCEEHYVQNKYHRINIFKALIECNNEVPTHAELVVMEQEKYNKDPSKTFIAGNKKNTFHVHKKIGDKVYLLHKVPQLPAYLEAICYFSKIWIEETTSTLKNAYCNEDLSFDFIQQAGSLEIVRMTCKGENLIPIDPSAIPLQLLPILRVSLMETVVCWANEETGLLKHIFFGSIKIKDQKEKHHHISVEYHNNEMKPFFHLNGSKYAVSHLPIQDLNTIPMHLKLERSSEENVVIIPKKQWISGLLQRGLNLTNIAPEIGCVIHELASIPQKDKVVNFNEHYLYSVEPDGTLDSRDPHALAYLASLFLVQGDLKLAKKYYDKIIFLSRQKHIPYSIFTELLPLAVIPNMDSKAENLRCSLLSALGRNFLLYPPKKPKASFEHSSLYVVLFASIALMDLHELQSKPSHKRLKDDEEWFLYKFSVNAFYSLLKNSDAPNFLGGLFNIISPESILHYLNVSPVLSKRILTLNKKFGIAETKTEVAAKLLANTLFTPTGVKPLELKEYLPTVELPSTTLCWDTLWSSYLSELFTHVYVRKNCLEELYKEIDCFPPKEVALSSKGFHKSLIPNFLGYYVILRENLPGADKLKKLLKIHRSGWSESSRFAIHLLSIVASHRKSCPHTLEIQSFIESRVKYPENSPNLNEFKCRIKNILSIPYKHLGVRFGAAKVVAPLAKYFLLDIHLQINPVISSPCKGIIEYGTAFFKGAKRIYDAQFEVQSEIHPRPVIQPEGLSLLDQSDSMIENMLSILYDTAFIEIPFFDPLEKGFSLFNTAASNASEKKKFDLINQSILDYYQREARIPPQNKLKNLESLWHVFSLSHHFLRTLEEDLETKKNQIKAFLNPPHLSELPRTSFKEWLQNIHDEDVLPVQKKLNLSPEALNALILNSTVCLILQSRINQFNKILTFFDKAFVAFEKNNGKEFAQQIELLGQELQARRAYKFTTTQISFRLSYRLLTYECKTKRILWKKQIEVYSEQFNNPNPHVLCELMPSLGKTEWGLGAQKTYFANGSFVPVTSVPKQHAKTNFRFISKQSQDVYGLVDHTLVISREQQRGFDSYQGIRINFMSALENRQGVNMCKESSQSLELEFLTLCHEYKHGKGKESKSAEEIKDILSFHQSSCKLLLDEAHHQVKQNRELIHPVGHKKHLSENLKIIILKTLQEFVDQPGILDAVIKNKLYTINIDTYLAEIVPAIAKKLSYTKHFEINSKEKRKKFINYVKDQKSLIPDFIAKHPAWEEIATIRGILTVVIKMVLPQLINVKYGVIKNDHLSEKVLKQIAERENIHIPRNACPFEGSDAPMLGFTVQSPFEDYVKSYFSYLHNGLTIDEINKLMAMLYEHANKEAAKANKPIETSVAFQYFESMCPNFRLKLFYSQPEREKINALLKHHPSAAYLYLRYFVSNDIYYWDRIARSNPTNYISMFHSSIQKTGTPYNDGVYFPFIDLMFDKGTLGEILHLISNKCPIDGIDVLPNDTAMQTLQSILKKYFTPQKKCSLLVDGAAIFNGISNLTIANTMADFCLHSNNGIQAIVFFHKDKLSYMDINSRVILPFSECRLPTEQRLTYFDGVHGFGSNVPQSDSAVITYKNQPFYKLLQESFRLREIKKILTLLMEGKAAEFAAEFKKIQAQEIFYVMLEETRDSIHPTDKIPSLKELFNHSILIESDEALPDNYEGYTQKIHNVVRRAILNKMIQAPDFRTMLRIYATYEDFLVPLTEVDPIKLFGWVLKEIPVEQAIELTKTNMIKVILGTSWFSKQEAMDLRSYMDKIPLPPLPTMVPVLTNGIDTETFVNEDLDRQLQVESDTTLETENFQELETQKESSQHRSYEAWGQFRETKWEMNYDPRSLEWRNASSPSMVKAYIKQQISSFSKKPAVPTLFTNVKLHSFEEICSKASSPYIHKIATYFDKRIWATENFIPLSEFFVEVKPFEYRHCNIHQVIVHIESIDGKDKVVSVGCLSQKDAKRWRTFIERPPTEKAAYKVILYDVINRFKAVGDDVDMDALRADPDFNSIEAQLRYLNGNVNLPENMEDALEIWASQHSPEKLSAAIKDIALRVTKDPYAGSTMDLMFARMLNIPLEDLL